MTDQTPEIPYLRQSPVRAGSLITAVALLGVLVPAAQAQSLTAGAVEGFVRSAERLPLDDALVTLVDNASGERRSMTTPRNGGFRFALLLAGDYDLVVERFGYRPRLIRHVPVRSGIEIVVNAGLETGSPDAPADTSAFIGAASGGTHLDLQSGTAAADFAALNDPRSLLALAGRLLPGADGELGAMGLPGRFGASAVDGVVRSSARHPRLAGAPTDALAVPLTALRGVAIADGADVEWPGAGGGALAAFTVPGARTLGARGSAGFGADGGAASFVLSGPIVRDTALFTLGVSAVRYAPTFPAPWAADSLTALAAGIARDSFQTDLSAYQNDVKPTTNMVAGFGRFDALVARDHRVTVRASAAVATVDDPILGAETRVALGSQLKSRELSAGAALVSTVGRQFGSELRLTVDAGNRDFIGAGLVGTRFVDGGFGAGSPGVFPGGFKRTTVRGSETGHLRLRYVTIKAGIQVAFTTVDQTWADGREGSFLFGDSTGFVLRQGAFRQTVGTVPVARFATQTLSWFAQTLLHPSPGLDLIAGVRWDGEKWPVDQIPLNTAWLQATGIDNRQTRTARSLLQPRVAFNWALGESRRWQVRGSAGLYAEALDPGVFAEVLTNASGASVRRGVGMLGAWPAPPDTAAAPVRGQSLTLLGPDFTPQRTGRAVFGIAGRIGGTTVRLQGDYRHTDFLPVRRDLNLPVRPRARDQFGRVLNGPLAKYGTLLTAVPGSNRRFAAFDEVSILDPAGASDYSAFTVGLERPMGRVFSLLAHYTFSRTTDNWFGARSDAAEAQFVPFADSTGRSAWAEGRSDFDVPHRLMLGVELRMGGRLGARLAVLYRWRSGYPFTPGFRDGVDANGDGSGRNDPAFISDTVAGASNVIAQAACLRGQVGRFAERNACRDPAADALDVRFAANVARFGRSTVQLVLDGYGLVRSGEDIYDHALYLLDGATALNSNAATGVTTVPLVANPDFRGVLTRRNAGAAFRAGIQVDF